MILMIERQEKLTEVLKAHTEESKMQHAKILGTLQNHNDRILTVENKSKPPYIKFFKFIITIFTGK